jgi:hypothetical protein
MSVRVRCHEPAELLPSCLVCSASRHSLRRSRPVEAVRSAEHPRHEKRSERQPSRLEISVRDGRDRTKGLACYRSPGRGGMIMRREVPQRLQSPGVDLLSQRIRSRVTHRWRRVVESLDQHRNDALVSDVGQGFSRIGPHLCVFSEVLEYTLARVGGRLGIVSIEHDELARMRAAIGAP